MDEEVAEAMGKVAHDLNNPISALTMDLFLLRRQLGAPLAPEIEAALDNLDATVGQLKELAERLERRAREAAP